MPQLDLASFFFQVFISFFAFFIFFNFSSYFILPNFLLILNLRLEQIKDLLNQVNIFISTSFLFLQQKRVFFFSFFSLMSKKYNLFVGKFLYFFFMFFLSFQSKFFWFVVYLLQFVSFEKYNEFTDTKKIFVPSY